MLPKYTYFYLKTNDYRWIETITWNLLNVCKNKISKKQLYKNISMNVRGAFNKFPDFFVQAFKIVMDSWKLNILLLYILWNDWTFFMISASNEQLQQQLEYTLLKPDCHS